MRETAKSEALYSNGGHSRAGIVVGIHYKGVGELHTTHGRGYIEWSNILEGREGERDHWREMLNR